MTTAVLALLAVLLAGPLPELISRHPALRRTPRPTMLLWQGVALAAVLAALGAGVSLVLRQDWHGPRGAPDTVGWVVAVVATGLTLVVTVRLLLSGHVVGRRLRLLRRRHLAQLDLLAERRGAVAVLDHDRPVAYCLPGVGRSRVVVSAGTLTRLAADEVEAVLAHERAHLRARHDLVLEAFSVLHRAFPRGVSSATALAEVGLLVEVLADRAAVRVAGVGPLARALVAVATGGEGRAPDAMLGAGGPDALLVRVGLLADRRPHRVQALLVTAAAVLVVLLPPALLLAG